MRKKICFIVATPITATAFLIKHFDYLSEFFDIYLVANFDDNPSIKVSADSIKELKNIKIHRNISLINDGASLVELQKYLRKMQFDAVHTVTPKAGLIGMLAAKLAGIRIRTHIFTGQVWHTKTGLFKELLKSIDRFIVYCSTNILVDGASQRQFLIANKIIRENNSQVLGKGSISGVDADRFVPDQMTRQQYREQLGITNEVVFVFLGRLNVDKGILDLAEAFSKLNQKHPNTKLVLIGPDEEHLEEQILKLPIKSGSVVFFGPTAKPQEALQLGDVFCLPSYREGFGTSVIEASLLELPVICSDTYGLAETIIENQTGLRHSVGNSDSILLQMEKMMTGESYRREMGKKGRDYVLENFRADKISNEWLRYYKTLLGTD